MTEVYESVAEETGRTFDYIKKLFEDHDRNSGTFSISAFVEAHREATRQATREMERGVDRGVVIVDVKPPRRRSKPTKTQG